MKKEIILKSGEKLQIVEATIKDAKQLLGYVKQVVDETNFLTFSSDEFLLTVEQEEKFIERMKKQENNLLLLAKIDNNIIGKISIASSKRSRIKHNGELGITIKKEYWNTGIGSALLTNVLDWARNNNTTTKINLSVSIDNVNAIKLYKKFNFEIEGERKKYFKINNEYVNAYFMGLSLN